MDSFLGQSTNNSNYSNPFSVWTNRADGIFAISCTAQSSRSQGYKYEGSQMCAAIQVNFLISLLIFIPLTLSILQYKSYYGRWFTRRQRIVYALFILNLLSILTYDVFKITELYNVLNVFLQLLFWDVLLFITKKLKNLTESKCIGLFYYVLCFCCIPLIWYFFHLSNLNMSELEFQCPTVTDSTEIKIKALMLTSVIFMYTFVVCYIDRMMSKDNDALYDESTLKKRKNTIRGIRLLVLTILISEGLQLLFSTFHIVKTPGACQLSDFDHQGLVDGIVYGIYRFAVVYLPILGINRLFWLDKDDRELKFTEQSYEVLLPKDGSKLGIRPSNYETASYRQPSTQHLDESTDESFY